MGCCPVGALLLTFMPEGSSEHWRPCTAVARGRRRGPAEDAAQLLTLFGSRRRCDDATSVCERARSAGPADVTVNRR